MQLAEKYKEKRKEMYDAFLDLEKMYGKLCRVEV